MKKVLFMAAAVLSSACDLSLPFDVDLKLNAVVVTVVDEAAAPVSGVRVSFADWTSSGSAFTVSSTTRPDGTTHFAFREPGQRKCEIQLPPGYNAGPAGLTQQVLIERETTVHVRFTLVRAPSAP